eukprot:jgi/Mesvir1/6311/Mv08145-RA.1
MVEAVGLSQVPPVGPSPARHASSRGPRKAGVAAAAPQVPAVPAHDPCDDRGTHAVGGAHAGRVRTVKDEPGTNHPNAAGARTRPQRSASCSESAKGSPAPQTRAAPQRGGSGLAKEEGAKLAHATACAELASGVGGEGEQAGQGDGGQVLVEEWSWRVESRRDLGSVLHVFSHVRHRMSVHWLQLSCSTGAGVTPGDITGLDGTKLQWVEGKELEARSTTLSSGMRKVYALMAAARAPPEAR